MSNLQLPTLNFARLIQFVPKPGDHKKIGYATHVEQPSQGILYLKHHENIIAAFIDSMVIVSTAGWQSRTTTDRLHRVLQAHGAHGYAFRMHKGDTWLYLHGLKVANMREVTSIAFNFDRGEDGNRVLTMGSIGWR